MFMVSSAIRLLKGDKYQEANIITHLINACCEHLEERVGLGNYSTNSLRSLLAVPLLLHGL